MKPTAKDWLKVQGGMPKIVKKNGILLVVHNYPGGSGAKVKTLPEQMKETVVMDVNGRSVEFPTAMLWELHGRPCENRSAKIGGEGYERISKV